MSEARVAATAIISLPVRTKNNKVKKSAPERYFVLPMTILLLTGLYPISLKRGLFIRFLFSVYTWSLLLFFVILNPISKAIALPSQTNLNELTDNISFLVNHVMAIVKIAVFLAKRKDLIRLVEDIQSSKFRHEDCSNEFSANNLIRRGVWTTQLAHGIFSMFVTGLVFGSIINAAVESVPEETLASNGTTFDQTSSRRNRTLPFLSWYPFSVQKSPAYEIIFVYQITAIFITAQMVMALDTLVVGFMVQLKVQFQILSHNLRFIISHAANRRSNDSRSVAATVSHKISNDCTEQFIQTIELDLERQILHHQAIIELSRNLESVFTYQLLMQFICSLFASCALLWQVSSTEVLSAKFASMLSYFGATAFQLLMFCWYGNEMMLESLSVAEAAWDSKWYEIISRRYSYGVAMIINRSQNVIVITAGGFADLSLNTFVMIIRAAYSVFAVLKKTGV